MHQQSFQPESSTCACAPRTNAQHGRQRAATLRYSLSTGKLHDLGQICLMCGVFGGQTAKQGCSRAIATS